MEMQKLIEGTRRAATGTLQSSQSPKWALRKKLICGTGGIKEEKKPANGQETQPHAASNHQLASAIIRDGNKIKTLHHMKTAAPEAVAAISLAQVKFRAKRQNQPLRLST